MNPRLAPWAIIYRASRRSTRTEQAAEFEKRKLCATPLFQPWVLRSQEKAHGQNATDRDYRLSGAKNPRSIHVAN